MQFVLQDLTAVRRAADREGHKLKQKGVEPRTSGFLEKWHQGEESESSADHQPLWTSQNRRSDSNLLLNFPTMRTNVWIYQALVCVVVTMLDTGKTVISGDDDEHVINALLSY